MAQNIPTDIDAAFEILLEVIEEAVNSYVEENCTAMEARDFVTARKLSDRAEQITKFRQKVDGIRKEWESLEALPYEHQPSIKSTTSASAVGKLPKGLRTPEKAYYKPILQALTELGGSASLTSVLDKVGVKMKGVLKDVDSETLSSNPNEQRWRNTAKWARNTMVQDGRLKSGSRQGVWEIAEEGRNWLRSNS